MLVVGQTSDASYRIWDLEEWDEKYRVIHLNWRKFKTGKDDIMLMDGDVHGDWGIDFFRIMTGYVLTTNNCGKLREGSNEGVD